MGPTISKVTPKPVDEKAQNETPPPPIDVIIYEEDRNGKWMDRRGAVHGVRKPSPQEGNRESQEPTDAKSPIATTVIFASAKTLATHARALLPPSFLTVVDDDLNGTFVCDYDYNEDGKAVNRHDSWTCFKIKMVHRPKKYNWEQPAVLVQWNPRDETQFVWFIDLPDEQETSLISDIQALPSPEKRHLNPYVWHALFANAVLDRYTKSFWLLRDIVRGVEKARDRHKPSSANDYFLNLHDIARHIIHSTETLQVAEATLSNLRDELSRWQEEHKDLENGRSRGSWLQTQQKVIFAAREIHSDRIRSQSLTERLQNEINLGFNLVSQRFGKDAQSDSAIMKTIGVVSLIYLPGTFVSGIFGTNFFDMDSPDEKKTAWAVSSNFWLYWAVTVPLTLATVVVWALWHYWHQSKRKLESMRKTVHGDGTV